MKLIITKMIRRYGQTVKRQKRIRHKDNGEVYYTYTVEEPIRGQFTQILPTDEAYNRWGRSIEADYIGCLLPGTEIYEGDLLYINDNWYECTTMAKRRTRGIVDYIEILLVRKK